MIIDVEKYATSHWSSFFKSIADISKSDSGVSLVESDKEILCFDDIVADYFDENKKPSSADGLTFSHKSINLIEFKTGFKKLITKANYKPEEVTCEKHEGEICEEYGALLLRYHSSNKEILMDSLKMKAIESYVFLDKQIIPLCHNDNLLLMLLFGTAAGLPPPQPPEKSYAAAYKAAAAKGYPDNEIR